jgi:hypothetical protein
MRTAQAKALRKGCGLAAPVPNGVWPGEFGVSRLIPGSLRPAEITSPRLNAFAAAEIQQKSEFFR